MKKSERKKNPRKKEKTTMTKKKKIEENREEWVEEKMLLVLPACLLAEDQVLCRSEHEIYISAVYAVVCRLDSLTKGNDRVPVLKNSGENQSLRAGKCEANSPPSFFSLFSRLKQARVHTTRSLSRNLGNRV